MESKTCHTRQIFAIGTTDTVLVPKRARPKSMLTKPPLQRPKMLKTADSVRPLNSHSISWKHLNHTIMPDQQLLDCTLITVPRKLLSKFIPTKVTAFNLFLISLEGALVKGFESSPRFVILILFENIAAFSCHSLTVFSSQDLSAISKKAPNRICFIQIVYVHSTGYATNTSGNFLARLSALFLVPRASPLIEFFFSLPRFESIFYPIDHS